MWIIIIITTIILLYILHNKNYYYDKYPQPNSKPFYKQGDCLKCGQTVENCTCNLEKVKYTYKNVNNTNKLYNFDEWKLNILNHLNNSNSLSDLLIIKDLNDIVYTDLLNCFEWKFKRLKILIRDEYKCNCCSKYNVSNHVHHKYYIKNNLPWIIDDSGLETLCYMCHKETHKNTKIPIYKYINGIKHIDYYQKLNCTRCGGIGYIPMYNHIENGVCFKCRGNTLKKSVFYEILEIHYNSLNNYQDNLLRKKYKDYIDSLSNEIISKCIYP